MLNKKFKLKKLFSLIFVFGILKTIVYFAPLGLNEVLESVSAFGEFEYSLNLGQTLMAFFSMGFAGAYAYFILKKKKDIYIPIFHLHFLILTFALIIISIVTPSLLNNIYFGAVIIGVAFSEQIFLSGVLKTKGLNNSSVIIDSGVYLVLAILIILSYLNWIKFSLPIWFISLLITLIMTSIVYHIPNLKGIKLLTITDYKTVYSYGILIVISGPLIYLLTNNTRLYIDYFTSIKDVGTYSFFFRITSFSLIFYRIIGILLFKKFFIDDIKSLDKKFALILQIVFIINLILYILIPLILTNRYELFDQTYPKNKVLFIICFFQVIFWINSALYEPIFQRENKMVVYIILLICSLLLFVSTLYLLNNFSYLDLNKIVWINTLFVLFLTVFQNLILRKAKLIFKKTLITNLIIGIIFLVTIFLL